jgi:hypothetical protein
MCERRLRRKEMANAVSMLREEIASLEQEINKRNRALAVLTESPAPVKSTPAPVKSAPAAAPVVVTLGERILAHLGANKGKLIAPVEIAKALAATDSNIKSESVQRRLGELFKRKRVKRDNGRYGV